MANNQSRGLIIASKTKGWDPTVIDGFGSIANFDYDPGNYATRFVGTLSDGNNLAWPDGYDIPGVKAEPPTFETPEPRTSKNYASRNANPNPGFPKGSY